MTFKRAQVLSGAEDMQAAGLIAGERRNLDKGVQRKIPKIFTEKALGVFSQAAAGQRIPKIRPRETLSSKEGFFGILMVQCYATMIHTISKGKVAVTLQRLGPLHSSHHDGTIASLSLSLSHVVEKPATYQYVRVMMLFPQHFPMTVIHS